MTFKTMAKGTIIAGLGLAACLYGSVHNVQAYQKAADEISRNTDYQESEHWEELADGVKAAENRLDYRSAWYQPIRVGKVRGYYG